MRQLDSYCNTIMRVWCAWSMTKAINTLRLCNYYFFSTATMTIRTRLNVKLRAYSMLLQLFNCNMRSSHFLYCIYQSFAEPRLIPSNSFRCKSRLSLKYGKQTDRQALLVVHPSFLILCKEWKNDLGTNMRSDWINNRISKANRKWKFKSSRILILSTFKVTDFSRQVKYIYL